MDEPSVAALWWAVILSGFYHGINPGMGWPLAVSAALFERKPSAMVRALALLAVGHFLAMIAILLPFSMMIWLVEREREIRIGAGLLLIALGLYLLITRKHPRFLARVHPAKLGLWSFLAAMAHGAGLMLVPIYLGICGMSNSGESISDAGHAAAQSLMSSDIFVAFTVALAHTIAMTIAGACLAIFIYYWLGLKFISKTWFNLDKIWALSLVLVGGLGIYAAITHAGYFP